MIVKNGESSLDHKTVNRRLIKENVSYRTFLSRNSENRGKILIFICASLIMAATMSITLFLTLQGIRSFTVDGLNPIKFLTGIHWNPESHQHASYGALPFIFGSFTVTILAALIAAPIGIGSALFMTEIAKTWGQKMLQPVIEILVGIPSVVYGLIGLSVIVPFIRSQFGGLGFGMLAAAIVVGIMILPTVASLAADAIKSVPDEWRQASYALGATKWQTIYKVVIPAALPSLLTAVVLGMARAFGEALAVQMVIGNAKVLPHSLIEPAATLTTMITLSMGHTTDGSVLNDALWSLGLILLIMTYIFIILIRFLSKRGRLS
ncbi:phosphate transport system permease protein [Scopulibacillus daqui]|uniref:Phosphate transport system permease protein n=1 Tax=Scopulibacillus daqui TaxID=1469162 RepID=A0ABS2Q1L2_9BACL|nr:phosphate ABC transporter permease subunit PstC [Scopulibacillus daqui]MBM7645750.1 phosphate transport system permease protein [Scopulibacillus daqui]